MDIVQRPDVIASKNTQSSDIFVVNVLWNLKSESADMTLATKDEGTNQY